MRWRRDGTWDRLLAHVRVFLRSACIEHWRQAMSGYGTVGYNVGTVGRWSRVGYGLLIALGAAASTLFNFNVSRDPVAFSLETVAFFAAIVLAYLTVYGVFGERVFARANPWLNTLVLVGPALLVAYWNLTVRHLTGVSLPGPPTLAMLMYVGISPVVEAWIGYGGCEVVALPILVFRRRYVTYCLPVVLGGHVRAWVGRIDGARRAVWMLLGLAALATIVLAVLNLQPLLSGLALLVLASLISLLVILDARRDRRARDGDARLNDPRDVHDITA
jgi:hypothetical protein